MARRTEQKKDGDIQCVFAEARPKSPATAPWDKTAQAQKTALDVQNVFTGFAHKSANPAPWGRGGFRKNTPPRPVRAYGNRAQKHGTRRQELFCNCNEIVCNCNDKSKKL